jgi:hypothetical protein
VWIHLSGYIGTAIRLISKNGKPLIEAAVQPVYPPYSLINRDGAGYYVGKANGFSLTYSEEIITENGQTQKSDATSKPILEKGGVFTLVTHGAPLHRLPEEIGSLVSPFFYADAKHTFYVEPTLTETTIEQWEEPWLASPVFDFGLSEPSKWKEIVVIPQVPIGPGPIESISIFAKYELEARQDWITQPRLELAFDDTFIGPMGGVAKSIIAGGEVSP